MEFLNSTELENLEIVPLNHLIDFTALHRVNPQRYPFILESSAQAENILAANIDNSTDINSSAINPSGQHARFDILFAFPLESLTLYSDCTISGENVNPEKDFLSNLDAYWLKQKNSRNKVNDKPDISVPFTGGWFVYLGYELAGQIEKRLKLPEPVCQSITAKLTRIPVAIIHDKFSGAQFIISEPEHKEKIKKILDDIQSINLKKQSTHIQNITLEEDVPEKYIQAIGKVKQYIKDGDVFQVNLSRCWQNNNAADIDALALYQSLKTQNPAPFSAYVDYGNYKIISSSPERLVKIEGRKVQTRPIAGTRARKNETTADIKNLEELISHPKERAEHIMLIDLERNDLGRICEPGSIHVDELMALESFQHVHHIVSNVSGKLKDGITPGDVIRAVFPGGTITGCPKERCMQIISELENVPRGAYTGSLGYINHDGSMDLNILIRTFELSANMLNLRAGAGLVADSIAVNELEETRAKAKGLLKALN